jgi:hypothetical protein
LTNTFADFFWSMIVIYFWIMVIFIFIRLFADIFRRQDLTGAWKALWIVGLFIVPFFAAIVYIIMRPKTASNYELAEQAAPPPAAVSHSTADEIAKLTALRDSGAITPAEYDAAKAKALA